MAIKKFLFVNQDGYYEEGTVEGLISTFNCDASLNAGDLVMVSSTITDGVDKVVDNNDVRSVIGWVYDKPTTTTAGVLTKGVIDNLSGLTKAGKVFLTTSGTFGSTMPTTGYLHILGHAVDPDTIDFDPVNTKIKLS